MCPIPPPKLTGMGRRRRPYLPGGVFHLTARTLRSEHRLTPRIRTAALRAIAGAAEHSGARPLAVAIMSNHLHIVAQQSDRPLSDLMQPLLRRLAHRVQDAHDLEGPVFWRPYGSQFCHNPSYVRNAIVYTHLNPVRAGLTDDPADYRWTSHRLYADGPDGDLPPELECLPPTLDPALALPLMARGPQRSTEQLRNDYREFVRCRIQADRADQAQGNDPTGIEPPSQPPTPWDDAAWGTALSPLFHAPAQAGARYTGDDRLRPFTPDLATLARVTLAAEAPTVSLESIRGRGGGARASRLRHAIIRRLHAAGFRNVEIARFLGLSESAVSWVLRRRRRV